MTASELKPILDRHKSWLAGEAGGHRADLGGADLGGAVLTRAVLTRANLRSAILRSAILSGAILSGAKELPAIDGVEGFRWMLLGAVNAEGCSLDMDTWHTCETVHCLAGWVVTIHPQGKILESIFETPTAAALILTACGETIPDFYDTGEGAEGRALNWLRSGKQEDPATETANAGS